MLCWEVAMAHPASWRPEVLALSGCTEGAGFDPAKGGAESDGRMLEDEDRNRKDVGELTTGWDDRQRWSLPCWAPECEPE